MGLEPHLLRLVLLQLQLSLLLAVLRQQLRVGVDLLLELPVQLLHLLAQAVELLRRAVSREPLFFQEGLEAGDRLLAGGDGRLLAADVRDAGVELRPQLRRLLLHLLPLPLLPLPLRLPRRDRVLQRVQLALDLQLVRLGAAQALGQVHHLVAQSDNLRHLWG